MITWTLLITIVAFQEFSVGNHVETVTLRFNTEDHCLEAKTRYLESIKNRTGSAVKVSAVCLNGAAS